MTKIIEEVMDWIENLSEVSFQKNIYEMPIGFTVGVEKKFPELKTKFAIIKTENDFIVEISPENHKYDIRENFRNLKDAKKYCLEYLRNI